MLYIKVWENNTKHEKINRPTFIRDYNYMKIVIAQIKIQV